MKPEMLTPEQEADVLRFEPWDERDATYVVLARKFVAVRKPHECAICFGPIAVGERVWASREADDGKVATFYFCAECCWAIAHRGEEVDGDPTGGYDRMNDRWEIGRKRAEGKGE